MYRYEFRPGTGSGFTSWFTDQVTYGCTVPRLCLHIWSGSRGRYRCELRSSTGTRWLIRKHTDGMNSDPVPDQDLYFGIIYYGTFGCSGMNSDRVPDQDLYFGLRILDNWSRNRWMVWIQTRYQIRTCIPELLIMQHWDVPVWIQARYRIRIYIWNCGSKRIGMSRYEFRPGTRIKN